MKECYLYKISGDYIECQTCNHYCRIAPFKRGICGVRENQKGKLYLLVYGRLTAENIDPIEKKPLFRYMPGTKTLSIATVGCNLKCSWCQNWDISQFSKDDLNRSDITNRIGFETEPKQIVEHTKKTKCPSISYTYTEPTVFLELAYDTMKLARKEGIKNIWVSNGYMSNETIEFIAPFLDAANIDLKSFDNKTYQEYCGGQLLPVLRNIETLSKKNIHLEVTTLVIPGVNDSIQELTNIAKFLARVSKEIPWHISRFFPSYRMQDRAAAPIEFLQQAKKIGDESGLKYVYIDNA